MSTAREVFEATVLEDDYVGYRTDVIKAADAWVRDEVKKAKLAALEEAVEAYEKADGRPVAFGGLINALRERYRAESG